MVQGLECPLKDLRVFLTASEKMGVSVLKLEELNSTNNMKVLEGGSWTPDDILIALWAENPATLCWGSDL